MDHHVSTKLINGRKGKSLFSKKPDKLTDLQPHTVALDDRLDLLMATDLGYGTHLHSRPLHRLDCSGPAQSWFI